MELFWQDMIVYAVVAIAAAWLIFARIKNKKNKRACGSSNCKCVKPFKR